MNLDFDADEVSPLVDPDPKLLEDYFGRVRVALDGGVYAGVLVAQWLNDAVLYMLEGPRQGLLCAAPSGDVRLSTEFREGRNQVARMFHFEMRGNLLVSPKGYAADDGAELQSIGDGETAYVWSYDPADRRMLPDGSLVVQATTLAREARRLQHAAKQRSEAS